MSRLVLFLGCIFTLHSQTFQGGVRGIVTDHSGAVVADAIVTLVNEATTEHRQTLTNPAGEYTFTAVLPATYRVRAQAPSLCAGHAQQLGGASPPANLMEVKA